MKTTWRKGAALVALGALLPGMAWATQAVPEPEIWSLLGIAAAAAVILKIRKARRRRDRED